MLVGSTSMANRSYPQLVVLVATYVLATCLRWAPVADAHSYHVDHSDEELEAMDAESLLHVETDLRDQNKAIDKRISSLRGRIDNLHMEQRAAENAYKKVEAARDWESRQKVNRVKELEGAKGVMETKRMQMREISEHATKLRTDIHELEAKLASINRANRDVKERYSRPLFQDVISNKAWQLGPVPQHLLNKTVLSVLPELSLGVKEARHLQARLDATSGVMSVLSTLVMYSFVLCMVAIIYRGMRGLRTMMTLPRVLFTVDMSLAGVWAVVLLWYCMLFRDPLQLLAVRHEAVSVVLQSSLMASHFANVMLRCLNLSATLTIFALGELFVVVFIAQHYYQTVWVRSLLDQAMLATFYSYFSYIAASLYLAVSRARRLSKPMPTSATNPTLSAPAQAPRTSLKARLEAGLRACEDILTAGMGAATQRQRCAPQRRPKACAEYLSGSS